MSLLRNLILSTLLLLSFFGTAHASESMTLARVQTGAFVAGATRFGHIQGVDSANSFGTLRHSPVSAPGNATGVVVDSLIAPGTGETYTIALYKNGVAQSLTCSISGATDTRCHNFTNVAFSANDNIFWGITLSSGANTGTAFQITLLYDSTTDGYAPLYTNTGGITMSTSATNYASFAGQKTGALVTTEFQAEIVIPSSGTIRNLYIQIDGAPGTGKSYTFTVRKNGSDQTLACAIANSNTACNDTSNTFTVSAGDTIALEVTPTGTPTARRLRAGIVFDADYSGEFIIPVSTEAVALSSGTTQYIFPADPDVTPGATESISQQIIMHRARLEKIYAEVSAAPDNGAGTQSYTFTLRKNTADTVLSCAISETATTCNDTGDVRATNCDDSDTVTCDGLSIQIAPSGTPTTPTLMVSLLGNTHALNGAVQIISF